MKLFWESLPWLGALAFMAFTFDAAIRVGQSIVWTGQALGIGQHELYSQD